ncbi:hypothetical protein J7K93_12600 [bacterium]|nr:hypothetical protein [bacterium]
MTRNRILFVIIALASVSLFCDKGDKNDLRTLFPGPGFEKGWSWDNMPVEYKHSEIAAGRAGEIEQRLSAKIDKMGKAVYCWGSNIDSSFTVTIYKSGNDSIAEMLSDSILIDNPEYNIKDSSEIKIYSFLNKQYLVIINTASKTEHIMSAVKTVADKLNENLNK